MPDDCNGKLVFVSHSSEDEWIAKAIARGIEDSGARPFLDVFDLQIGAKFEEKLREKLNLADELLVLLTPRACEKPYVWMEIGAAWNRCIPIVVVRYYLSLDELRKLGLPVAITERNLIHLNDIDRYLDELRQRANHEHGEGGT